MSHLKEKQAQLEKRQEVLRIKKEILSKMKAIYRKALKLKNDIIETADRTRESQYIFPKNNDTI